jgi:hypothetical protein
MTAGQIRVKTEDFEEQAVKLDDAIARLEPQVVSFSHTLDSLTGNSDFLDSFKKALSNMSDDIAPELLADIKGYYDKVKLLAGEFRQADDGIASGLQGGDDVTR